MKQGCWFVVSNGLVVNAIESDSVIALHHDHHGLRVTHYCRGTTVFTGSSCYHSFLLQKDIFSAAISKLYQIFL